MKVFHVTSIFCLDHKEELEQLKNKYKDEKQEKKKLKNKLDHLDEELQEMKQEKESLEKVCLHNGN